MGRRAFTNPSKIESERERARNQYRRQQQRRQNLVRQECSTCPVIRVVNSIHGQMLPEGLVRNGTTIALPAHQSIPSAPTSAITMLEEARPSGCSIGHSPSTACNTTDIQVASPLTGQPAATRRGAEQVAAHIIDAPPTCRPWPRHQSASPGTGTPRGCTPQPTQALAQLRVQRYRNRLHRLRIPPTLPFIVRTEELPSTSPRESDLGTMIDCRCRFVAGTPDHLASTRYVRTDPQPCPVCSGAESAQCSSGFTAPVVSGNRKETLDSFIDALRYQNTELSSDFLGSHETAYDHAFRIFFNSKCTSDKPSEPLSFRKSQIDLFPANEPELVLSRQWDVDSIWLGATGLQAIRPPNNFRLSFLPSFALNLSCDEVIQPHGLELAKTRHIRLGTFNTHSVHFSAFLFFPSAAPDSTSATRNALSLERQKDLYDHIIIPAAHEAVSDPYRQEIPLTYDVAYAKSRSFQEKPGNDRWRPDDVNRAVHLQYTIPAGCDDW
ncbi:hypothetical protein FALBO_15411, partial [Fusarium albosuccineum]